MVLEVDAGHAGAGEQRLPGLRAREELLLPFEVGTDARWPHDHDAHAACTQRCDGLRGALDLCIDGDLRRRRRFHAAHRLAEVLGPDAARELAILTVVDELPPHAR